MTTFQNLSKLQKARVSLHRDVQAICKESCHLLGLEITKPAMEIIAELLYKKISIYGLDLEAFAKHAKRSTINADDVKLLVRRNPSLKTHLNTIQSNQPSTSKDKRRKTNATALPILKELPPVQSKPEVESVKDIPNKDESPKDFEMDDKFENMLDTIDLTFD
ncbi:unnamed protein product [Parnassius apollo]|uniref:(apollo) hypothetical protein n=1 Tax=Parnassius apollo TaxID=110799 RepID=A0A8S3W500_PARAO|nr:unnamed protein product [Parnassius apollo]